MQRRRFLTAAAGATAALALPMRVAAKVGPDARTRRILDVARRELDRAGDAVTKRDLVAIADFGLHSSHPRFHLANLEAGTVDTLLVAHGAGSDPEHDGWLNGFSNLPDSWATSRGAYATGQVYRGRHGTSMRLEGLAPSNSNAFARAIVMHKASYVTPGHVARYGVLGRSNGCFALDPADLSHALARLPGGRLLFADRLGIGPDGQHVAMPRQKPVNFAAIAARHAEA